MYTNHPHTEAQAPKRSMVVPAKSDPKSPRGDAKDLSRRQSPRGDAKNPSRKSKKNKLRLN